MNRLSVRLLLSHLLVAAVAGLTVFLTVRLLLPELYDRGLRMMGRRMGPGSGQGRALRAVVVDAADNALLLGVLAGIVTAVVAGALLSRRILRPLADVSSATHRMADGDYSTPIALPGDAELAAVARDVNTLAERLATTEARRVRLLGEVAHEMRTPLTVIDGYVEGVVDGVFQPTPDLMADLSAEVRRLRRLADDLAALSRAEEGGLDLRLQDVDLGAVTAAAAARLRSQFDDAGVALVGPSGSAPLPVRADPDRLGQVVTNLLGNALAATPAGGSVTIAARRDGAEAALAVADTGVGLSRDDLPRVFERFYRVHGVTEGRARPGSGIGLTVARGIATAHGGTLDAHSPGPGRGATFTLRLPLRPGGARAPGAAPPPLV